MDAMGFGIVLCGVVVGGVLLVVLPELRGGMRGVLRVVCFALVLAGAAVLTVGALLVVKGPAGWDNPAARAGLLAAAGGAAIVVAGVVLDRAITRSKSGYPPRGFDVNVPTASDGRTEPPA